MPVSHVVFHHECILLPHRRARRGFVRRHRHGASAAAETCRGPVWPARSRRPTPHSRSETGYRNPPGDGRPMQVRMGIVLRREWLRVRPAPAPPRWALIRSHRTGQSGRGGDQETAASGKHHHGNFDRLLGCCRRGRPLSWVVLWYPGIWAKISPLLFTLL